MKIGMFAGTLAVAGATIMVSQMTHTVSLTTQSVAQTRATSTEQVAHMNDTHYTDAQEVDAGAGGVGTDVIMPNIHQISKYGPIGDIHAYSIGSHTCSAGDQPLVWQNNGSPGLAMNAYRLHDGRLMQIGLSFVKHACCAVNFGACGGHPNCQWISSSLLGVGCLDVYSATWNAGQGRLGPRSNIDPYRGNFSPLPGGTGNSIFRRLQVLEQDLDQNVYGDALYFVEGVYVGDDDADDGNWLNNATYRRVTVNGSTFTLSLTGSAFPTVPAIFAWADHGNGPGQPSTDVNIEPLDIVNEGRLYVASKATDNGDGTWRYDYAIYNLNSRRGAEALTIHAGTNAGVTDVGFHSPFYHSGEQVDNDPWDVNLSSDSITWELPEDFIENPNGNAVRWGTMYNYWFTSTEPPVTDTATVRFWWRGFPGDPNEQDVIVTMPDPGVQPECLGDITGPEGEPDGVVNVDDLLLVLNSWGECIGCPGDINNDDIVNVDDLLIVLNAWGSCD